MVYSIQAHAMHLHTHESASSVVSNVTDVSHVAFVILWPEKNLCEMATIPLFSTAVLVLISAAAQPPKPDAPNLHVL